jgi:predicted HTH domain antitoxin
MRTKTVKVNVEVPADIPDQTRKVVESEAEEAVVLALWKTGELSTRRAAEELGLSYRDFLDLLTARGLPIERGDLNLEAIEAARQKLARGQP